MKKAQILALGLASALVTGCAATPSGPRMLTDKAFRRAAKSCMVVSQGVGFSKGRELPHASYKIVDSAGQTISDEGEKRACIRAALTGYRYDYLGEEVPKTSE